ncbi:MULTISPECIES: glycosyltransferase family 2 protein [Thermomonospora]|uniref:Glycosyl transferase family 2 n=1 Tax=Thermomonospora curvata (strain ATCC 19995 / DSM 43183 / JCM 3096 / KCTC 9072 / NBRC 15933 / NCIMB 10081 / Henssen B9) TaxID=471852 RepID=D1A7H3_THECD|nr:MULTISPECIES: glycosyltransferase family 2 protein [Thermomonospora]ACY96562.1 glycosyl transferase family 2 [Thermomonospora curvata DSM 43183]
MELSVVMPCLNEAETLETCIRKALGFFEEHGIDGEVVVADNGSTDGSQQIARAAGARVVPVADRGYGNALMGGIRAARGRYVVMGDADDSYDFTALMPFLKELRDGADLVMGNRFKGGIEPGAMPPLHRYLGNPVLSFIGRLFFGSKIGDFHCGLRAFRRDSILRLGLQTGGMEFASEMVVRATLAGYDIREVPTTLSKDGRSRPPHLNTWRDGWRHLRFLLLYSPRWLFLIPGLLFMLIGLAAGIALSFGPVRVGDVAFDVDTLVGAGAAMVIGFQAVLFALFTKVYAMEEGFLPRDRRVDRLVAWWTMERGLVLGGLLALAGLAGLVASLLHWRVNNFGELDPRQSLRMVVPSATALVMSFQAIFASMFVSILYIRRREHPRLPDAAEEAAVVVDAAADRVAAEETGDGKVSAARAAGRDEEGAQAAG